MIQARAYLLAAGNGRRAGGPKAWLVHEGKTLLQRQLDFLLGRFSPQSVAVSIQPAWLPRCLALNPAVRWVPVDPLSPPMGAFLSLIKDSPLTDWGFLYHVDMPLWEPALFDLLLERAGRPGARDFDAIVPVYKGRKGHPVLLSSETETALLALDPAKDRLDLWLRTRTVGTVEVPFACVLENWNAPAPAR